MICLWYGRNSQPILRVYFILFLIEIKCLTFIQNFTHDDIVKKRRHKIRDMIIIFQNRIKWGGYKTYMTVFSDWIDHDRQYQLNKSWYDLIFMRRQWVKFCMICLWYGRNSQPILREFYILFLIGIKCLTFIQNLPTMTL